LDWQLPPRRLRTVVSARLDGNTTDNSDDGGGSNPAPAPPKNLQAATTRNDSSTPTFAAIKRLTRDTALATWTSQWKDRLNNDEGRFKIAKRFPPSFRAREHFTDTERSIYGRMLQCRTGHCFAGEYYADFVPSERMACPCGARRQSRQHIICECPQYENARRHLQKPNVELSLTDVLGTKKGLQALALFLRDTDAFKKATASVPNDELDDPRASQ
ncbi:hypothetical protein CONPUDRAFT_160359, partial [Coniophora puteana RWD-64-598 SS2]